MKPNSLFEYELSNKLRRAGFTFEMNPIFGGISPDFIVTTSDGRRVVIEAKTSARLDNEYLSIAARQVSLYRKVAKADLALVVVRDLKKSRPSTGVLREEELIPALRRYEKQVHGSFTGEVVLTKSKPMLGKRFVPGTTPTVRLNVDRMVKSISGATNDRRFIFASMPYKAKYEDTYFDAMGPAAQAVNAVCNRADYDTYSGDVLKHVKQQIKQSIGVIADLSESRPNVLYELGFADALGVKAIQICSTRHDKLPLAVRNNNTIQYTIGRIHQLRTELIRMCRNILQ